MTPQVEIANALVPRRAVLQLHAGVGGIWVHGAAQGAASKEGLLLSIGETLIVSRRG
jgi:hypothetical protein